MLRKVGEIAVEKRCHAVELVYSPTERNKPALAFCSSLVVPFEKGADGQLILRIAAERALAVQPPETVKTEHGEVPSAARARPTAPLWRLCPKTMVLIAEKYNTVEKIKESIESRKPKLVRAVPTPYVDPRNALEERLVTIWAGILKADRIGVLDNFFELGGHSLLGTVLLSRISNEFGIELPLYRLFESPTVAAMASLIEQEVIRAASEEDLAQACEEIGIGRE
jgi:acyl carrier protein